MYLALPTAFALSISKPRLGAVASNSMFGERRYIAHHHTPRPHTRPTVTTSKTRRVPKVPPNFKKRSQKRRTADVRASELRMGQAPKKLPSMLHPMQRNDRQFVDSSLTPPETVAAAIDSGQSRPSPIPPPSGNLAANLGTTCHTASCARAGRGSRPCLDRVGCGSTAQSLA